MNDRYCIERSGGERLYRRSSPPGVAWAHPDDSQLGELEFELIALTKEGAEQMALNLGGTARKLVSPNNPEADR